MGAAEGRRTATNMCEGTDMSGERRGVVAGGTEVSLKAFHRKCRQMHLKVTPQRTTIYRALLETDEHPSAEAVFRTVRAVLPSISLDTVNRTLLTLSKMGVAFVVEGSGDAKRFDANLETHQHFRCLRCKRIIDFQHEPFNGIDVPRKLRDRFVVLRKTVYLEGFCDRCRDRAS
jgi:Fur family peroxide stress response transcriptional regulator